MELTKIKYEFDKDYFIGEEDLFTYVCSLKIKGNEINVYMDDYGQCYCFTYMNNGNIDCLSCGTYNFNFLDDILYTFDPKGFTISAYGEDEWNQRMVVRDSRGLDSIDYDDYELYNIDELYKQLEM